MLFIKSQLLDDVTFSQIGSQVTSVNAGFHPHRFEMDQTGF